MRASTSVVSAPGHRRCTLAMGFAFFTAVHVVTCALTKFNPVCNTALAASSNRSGVLADC